MKAAVSQAGWRQRCSRCWSKSRLARCWAARRETLLDKRLIPQGTAPNPSKSRAVCAPGARPRAELCVPGTGRGLGSQGREAAATEQGVSQSLRGTWAPCPSLLTFGLWVTPKLGHLGYPDPSFLTFNSYDAS